MISESQQSLIRDILARFKPRMVGVFGSYARGEESVNSDLDLLVDFEHPVDLLDIIGVEQELSEKLAIKVDLVTLRSLHPGLKKYVERDLVKLVS